MKRIAHYQYLEYVRVRSLMRQYQAASAPLRVLDFGCGLGKFLNVFASLGMEVTGVDANPAYVAGARERASRPTSRRPSSPRPRTHSTWCS
jgi:2-polyprenyl-3-methyl-5-hydroxy-6-metoxy-1,4-benzoquinol methylase